MMRCAQERKRVFSHSALAAISNLPDAAAEPDSIRKLIPIYVINLDRAPERMAHARAQLDAESLVFQRITAIDGRELTDADIAAVHDAEAGHRHYHVPLQRGEIACYLSHRAAWQAFLAGSAAPFAVTLEDDFAFERPLAPVIERLAAFQGLAWDVIKLRGNGRTPTRTAARLGGGDALLRELLVSTGTVGLMVSRAGAQKLLARTLPIRRPIDAQLRYPWELGVNIQTIHPPVVMDVGETRLRGSTARAKADRRPAAKLKREARRLRSRMGLIARSLRQFVTP